MNIKLEHRDPQACNPKPAIVRRCIPIAQKLQAGLNNISGILHDIPGIFQYSMARNCGLGKPENIPNIFLFLEKV
jgi:hypothetical protein